MCAGYSVRTEFTSSFPTGLFSSYFFIALFPNWQYVFHPRFEMTGDIAGENHRIFTHKFPG
jgi:hypothetical protein